MSEQPNPFARTRDDHRHELAEDYAELILRLSEAQGSPVRTVELVRALQVAQPTVTKALDRLKNEGLIRVFPREGVELTPEGEAMARASLARHELIVAFLIKLGVPAGQAEVDTEGIEHHVSGHTLAAMERYLREP